MPGILIIAHAPLASALRDCAAHVYAGCPSQLEALDVPPDASPESMLPQAQAALQRVAGNDGAALLLVDAAGATPCNLAQRLARAPVPATAVRVVSGVNLPMLLRTLCYQNEPLDALLDRALAGGARGIAELHNDETSDPPPC
ncbi:MAG: PTS sugar transporter subunit IIA [Thiomonas sp.]|uniref:Putative Phosphotransferase system,mannose/fructose-specific component IIA n=1 Tax=mine drainage metagenome TaxID=410659 RepID=E6PNT0_9ZZZZ